MSPKQERDLLVSQTTITVCTGCGRTKDQVVPGARCRNDREHKWSICSRQDWDNRPHYVFGGGFRGPFGTTRGDRP